MAGDNFCTTRWSVVRAAGTPDHEASEAARREAFASLCNDYWGPLYDFARRRCGDADKALDLTQSFIAELLEKNMVSSADPGRGRFRAFLLGSFKHFLSHCREKQSAVKRGGRSITLSLQGHRPDVTASFEPASTLTPEQEFDRRWALMVLDRVLKRLQAEFEQRGQAERFETLRRFLVPHDSAQTYAEAASSLGISEGGMKMMVHRMRGRYRELMRAEIGDTVADPEEIDEEMRWLFRALEKN